MVTATIEISLAEEFGLTAVSRDHPDAMFRYLSGIEEPDRGLGLVEVRAENLDELLEHLQRVPEVRAFELLDRYERRAIFRYETGVATLYRAVRDADILPAFPYTVRDGVLTFRVTTSTDRLSRFGEILRSLGWSFEVRAVSNAFDETDFLTDRQWHVLTTAVDAGYYDSPRRCTLTELADELAIAPSSASELLHRAEGRVVRWFVSERDELGDRAH
jgi:predicted DNA binding protein